MTDPDIVLEPASIHLGLAMFFALGAFSTLHVRQFLAEPAKSNLEIYAIASAILAAIFLLGAIRYYRMGTHILAREQ